MEYLRENKPAIEKEENMRRQIPELAEEKNMKMKLYTFN